MTERIRYEHIDEQLIGRRLAGIQHTGASLSEPDRRELQLLNEELRSDPPPIALVAWNGVDAAVAIGLGAAQRGLDAPDGELDADAVRARRATRIDDRPVQGYEREVGVGPGGWIEVTG